MEQSSLRRKHYDNLITKQDGSGKTAKSRIRECFTAMAVSFMIMAVVGLLLLFGVLGFKFEDLFRSMGPLLGIAGILAMIVGVVGAPVVFVLSIIMMIVFAVGKRKTITCPFCGKKHTVYSHVTSYICDGCANLLLMNKGENSALLAARCPVCRSPFGASPDMDTRCVNCGATVHIERGQVYLSHDAETCTKCGATINAGMYLCPSCGALHADPTKDIQKLREVKMYSRHIEGNKYGHDAITELMLTDLGFLVRAAWLYKPTEEMLKSEKRDLTSDFLETVRLFALSDSPKNSIEQGAISAALDYLLAEFYKSQMIADDAYPYSFGSEQEIETRRSQFGEIGSLHSALYSRQQGGGTLDKWPHPIIGLASLGGVMAGNRFIYSAKVTNGDKIRQFIAENQEPVDIGAAVTEAMHTMLTT